MSQENPVFHQQIYLHARCSTFFWRCIANYPTFARRTYFIQFLNSSPVLDYCAITRLFPSDSWAKKFAAGQVALPLHSGKQGHLSILNLLELKKLAMIMSAMVEKPRIISRVQTGQSGSNTS